ncbi:unnamed protein product [Caretta caretta]
MLSFLLSCKACWGTIKHLKEVSKHLTRIQMVISKVKTFWKEINVMNKGLRKRNEMTEMLFPGLSKYISEDVASAGKCHRVERCDRANRNEKPNHNSHAFSQPSRHCSRYGVCYDGLQIWIVSSVSSMSTRKHFDKELDGIFQFLEVDVEEFPPESMQRSQAPAEEY